MRYQLLLKEILKSTERMGEEPRAIRSALQVMITVPTQANDMMNVGRVKDLPCNVHALGELKLQDMLLVSEPVTKDTKDPKEAEKKLKERRVFLFQQAMVFCEEIPAKDKYSSPNYIYKYDLKINKLQHKDFKRIKDAYQFILVEVDAGHTRRVLCQCNSEEQYETWVTNLHKVLQRQIDLIQALINPTEALKKELLTWEKADDSYKGYVIQQSTPTLSATVKHSNTFQRTTRSFGRRMFMLKKHHSVDSQDSSLLSSPFHKLTTSISSNNRGQIKKSMSDRTGKLPNEPTMSSTTIPSIVLPSSTSPSSNLFLTTISPKKYNHPRTQSHSDTNKVHTLELSQTSSSNNNDSNVTPVRKPFNLFDTILQRSSSTSTSATSFTRPLNIITTTSSNPSSISSSISATGSLLSSSSPVVSSAATYSPSINDNHNILSSQQQHSSSNDYIPSSTYDNYRSLKKTTDNTLERRQQQQQQQQPTNNNTSNQLPDTAKCLFNYNAIKEDEICVQKGEYVQIVAANQDNRYFVHREQNTSSPAAEGWIPGHIIGLRSPINLTQSLTSPTNTFTKSHHQQHSHPVIPYQSTLPPQPHTNLSNSTSSDGQKRLSLEYSSRQQISNRHHHYFPPEFTIPFQDRTVIIPNSLTLIGHVSGNPRPAIVWQHPLGHTLISDGGVHVNTLYNDDGTIQLQIVSPTVNDSGVYECIATSPYGTISQKVRVVVKDAYSTHHVPVEQVRWSTRYSNDYRELNELARGRFCIVKHCLHNSTGHDVCTKLIYKKLTPVDRALHEYAILSSLKNESIMSVYAFMETDTFSIIVGELISGGRLFDHLCFQSSLNELVVVKYIRQLLNAVYYLHRCKMIHLDLKPENLLIDIYYHQIKLVDFGDTIRLTNMRYIHRLTGNAEFSAPEIIEGNAVNYKTDIWSIGVLVYVLLSGLSPFLDDTDEQTCQNILNIDYMFPDVPFLQTLQRSKQFIQMILVREVNSRPSASECLSNEWIQNPGNGYLSTTNLIDFVERRKSQINQKMLISSIITICLLICVQSQYITLPPLPYNYDALEPILSEKIMRLHHLKHHQTYTTKVNTAIESIINETTDKDLIKLMKSDINTILTNLNQIPQPYRQTLRNNGGGYINHKLFWHLMTKPTYINETIIEPQPDGILLNEINNK
ncbi:unnamed protein product, partial [Didymodactylos carnosus]